MYSIHSHPGILKLSDDLEQREASDGLGEDCRKEGNEDNNSRDKTEDLSRHVVALMRIQRLQVGRQIYFL